MSSCAYHINMFRALLSALGKHNKPRNPFNALEYIGDERGGRIMSDDLVEASWDWNDINRIRTYKVDSFDTDEICILLECADGQAIELGEDHVNNFHMMRDTLDERFSFPEDWWHTVAFPAFARNERVLWERL